MDGIQAVDRESRECVHVGACEQAAVTSCNESNVREIVRVLSAILVWIRAEHPALPRATASRWEKLQAQRLRRERRCGVPSANLPERRPHTPCRRDRASYAEAPVATVRDAVFAPRCRR